MIQSIENKLRTILENDIVSTIIKIFLICYSVYIAPKLSNHLLVLFDNIFFKILIISLIFYISQVEPVISILLSIAFILSIYTINNLKLQDLLNISIKEEAIENVIEENVEENMEENVEENMEEEENVYE